MNVRKLLAIGTATALAVGAALVGGAPATAATTSPPTGSYVALGDSYASGNGAGNYDPASGTCYRSPGAYPAAWAQAYPSVKTVSYACSGATTDDVLGTPSTAPQIATALAGATEVSLQVGGNDIGFATALTSCLLNTDEGCAAYLETTAKPAIMTALPAQLDNLYARLRALAPQARVTIVGYARLFDEAAATCSWSPAKRQVLNGMADLLSTTIAARAAASGFSYVDIRAAFAGHGVCSTDQWIHPLFDGQSFEWFHPTAAGHAAQAVLLPAPRPQAQAAYSDGKLSVAIRSDLYTSAQRVIVWINGAYAAETYRDVSYYATIAKSQGTVTVTPVGTVRPGDRVQVGIVPGAPGDAVPSPGTVPLLVDTQADTIQSATLSADGRLTVSLSNRLFTSATHVTFYVNGVYHGATESGLAYYLSGYVDGAGAHLVTDDGGFTHGDHLTVTAGSQTIYDTYL